MSAGDSRPWLQAAAISAIGDVRFSTLASSCNALSRPGIQNPGKDDWNRGGGGRKVKLGSSDTQKPHKKPTLAGMEDIGRPKENRDPIQSIKSNLLRGSFEEAWGSGRGRRRKGRCHPLTWDMRSKRRGGANEFRSNHCDNISYSFPPFLIWPMIIAQLVWPSLPHDRSQGLHDKTLNKHLRW